MTDEEKRLEEISASVTRYYDSITEEERAENRAWGEFALSQFAREESSNEWQCEPADAIGDGGSETQGLVIARQLREE